MASRSHYRIQHVATTPRGWKVRSIEQGGHVIRIAFPPGRREQGSGHVVEILHPKHENPGVCSSATRAMNPAELVLMGANPTRSQRIRGARERSEEIRRVHHEFNPHDPLWAIRWDTGNVSQAFHSKGEAERMLRNFHGAGKLIRVQYAPSPGIFDPMNPMPASGERYRNPIVTKEQKEQILKLWQEDGKSIAQISKIVGLDIWDVHQVTETDYRRHVARVEAH